MKGDECSRSSFAGVIDLDVKGRIVRARVQLILKQPFYGYLATYLSPKEIEMGTAGTGGQHLYYSKKWISELPEEQVEGVLAHEILHLALGHLWRRGTRSKLWFNLAADYAINPIVLEHFALPEGVLYDRELTGLSAEQIYERLQREAHKFKACGGKTLDDHGFWESPSEGSRGYKSLAERVARAERLAEEWKRRVVQAANAAKQQGKLPIPLGWSQ